MHHKEWTPVLLKSLKNKRISVAQVTKKPGKYVLIQLGSVTIKAFGKINNPFSVKNER